MKIGCARGCGFDVEVDDRTLKEALDLGAPMRFQHDTCPNEPGADLRSFRITATVSEFINPGLAGETEERLAQFGDTVEAPNFAVAVESLGQALQKQWQSIVGMVDVIDEAPQSEDGLWDEVADARDLNSTGYGRCKGCGGQEPHEVLSQMSGYCSSQCEREDNDDDG